MRAGDTGPSSCPHPELSRLLHSAAGGAVSRITHPVVCWVAFPDFSPYLICSRRLHSVLQSSMGTCFSLVKAWLKALLVGLNLTCCSSVGSHACPVQCLAWDPGSHFVSCLCCWQCLPVWQSPLSLVLLGSLSGEYLLHWTQCCSSQLAYTGPAITKQGSQAVRTWRGWPHFPADLLG